MFVHGLSSLKQFLIPIRLELSGLNYKLAISKYGIINGMVLPVILFANFFINSFSTLLIPEYSRLLAGKNFNRMKVICLKIFEFIFVFSILICGIFLFFSNDISYLIYKNIEIGIYFKIFSPLILFMYIDSIIDSMLKGINCQVGSMIINICDLLLTIILIYFIVPIYGLSGYILSIFISEIFNFTFSFLLLKNKLKFKFNIYLFLIKPIFILLISFTLTLPFSLPYCLNIILFISLYILLYFISLKKVTFF